MSDLGVTLGNLEQKAEALRRDGATALFLAVDGKPGGVIAVADPIKPTTRAALDSLRKDGIRIVMLTGDNKTTAQAVARLLGIEEVEADVLPEDKHRIVKKLTVEGHGWRRRKRRPGVGRGGRRHRNGDRDGSRDTERRHYIGERRSRGGRTGHRSQPGHDAEYPPKSGLRLRLQRDRNPNCGRRPVSILRAFAQPDRRGPGNVAQLRFGDRECTATAYFEAMTPDRGSTTALWAISSVLLGIFGASLVVIGVYFILLRPQFLPEDFRYIGVSQAQLESAAPGLGDWLNQVFRVLGGYVSATGILTVALAATSYRSHHLSAAIVAASAGVFSIGSMTIINFQINSDFKWVLLGIATLWACSLALFLIERFRANAMR
jgi:hypothetical protein